jgi:hypothetical protein
MNWNYFIGGSIGMSAGVIAATAITHSDIGKTLLLIGMPIHFAVSNCMDEDKEELNDASLGADE